MHVSLCRRNKGISIHSPHARGDSSSCVVIVHQDYFNPLPSREGRLSQARYYAHAETFQSTPLTRGETSIAIFSQSAYAFQSTPLTRGETYGCAVCLFCKHFNPLPSREGRHGNHHYPYRYRAISIHSPHARGDSVEYTHQKQLCHFNPLPSREGRQHKPPKILLDSRQSIQQKHHSSFF